jgi:hypothetical protein
MQALRARITAGEDFATLASQESHCSSARRGGDLGEFGWVLQADLAFSVSVTWISAIRQLTAATKQLSDLLPWV